MKALIEAKLTQLEEQIRRLEELSAYLTALLAEADHVEAPAKKRRGRKPKRVGLPAEAEVA